MWNTALGKRTLEGAEANVFRETLGELVDAVRAQAELNVPSVYGIPLFDNLHWQQKIAMLLRVARPLLLANEQEPPSSALRDATVAAVYAQMLTGVEVEIDAEQSSTENWEADTLRRKEIVQALKECEPDRSWLDPECIIIDEWQFAVSALQDRVLADEDWKIAELTLDLPPQHADGLRQSLGIDRDYACDIPPDVDERSPKTVLADLIELTTGQRPDEQTFADLPQ